MGCCSDIAEITATIAAAAIYDGAVTADYSVHDGKIQFPCAAFGEGGRGKILQAYMQINNDDSSAITQAFKLHLHNNSTLTTQTKGVAVTRNDTDHAGHQGDIAIAALSAMLGDSNVSKSLNKEVNIEYKVADNDTALYGILTPDALATFDASATITIKLIIQKY